MYLTYRVEPKKDNIYRVIEIRVSEGPEDNAQGIVAGGIISQEEVHSGSIADCEAFINLRKQGYI